MDVTGLTATRMLAIEAASVVSGTVNGSFHLILTKFDGTTIDAGNVRGATGATGATGPTGPSGALTGEIKEYPSTVIPSGYLLCDGSAVSRTTYAALFAVCGTTYGVGDGSTTFNLPNFTNKFARGNTPGPGGGVDTHAHTSSPHAHPLSAAGQAMINQFGTTITLFRVATSAWTGNQAESVTANVTPTSNNFAASLMGATDLATAPDTGSSSNVPAYTGVVRIIKT